MKSVCLVGTDIINSKWRLQRKKMIRISRILHFLQSDNFKLQYIFNQSYITIIFLLDLEFNKHFSLSLVSACHNIKIPKDIQIS